MRVFRVGISVLALLGCGGASTPMEPPTPVVPIPSLPVLTTLSVLLPVTELPVGQKTAASITAADERMRPMQIGLVAWSSNDTAIARIGSDGIILGLREGVLQIGAAVGDVSARRELRIGPLPPGPIPVAAVAVLPVAVSIAVGHGTRLTVALSDFAGRTLLGREITWVTGDDAIASVAADGTVTARASGVVIVEAISEGVRGAAQVVVTPMLDAGIVISMAVPVPSSAVRDSLTVVATVRSARPLVSVAVTIAGTAFPMTFGQIPKSTKGPAWSVIADVSGLPFGPLAVVATARDNAGGVNVVVVPIVRDPSLTPGSKAPPQSK